MWPANARPQRVLRPRRPPAQEAVLQVGRFVTRSYGMATADLRPPPDFMLIGAKRGGTTSAYFHVLTHPHVLRLFPNAKHLPKARDTKGTHYFSSEYDRGRRWFYSHFPSRAVRAAAQRRAPGVHVAGEASPYYLFHPLAAERAAAEVPGTRLLIALRDPVERTWSHFREQTRNKVETLSFEDALAAEADRVGDDAQRLVDDPTAYSFAHEHQTFAAQSEYAASLRRWLDRYPPERVHVWASEDYYADADATVRGICRFLGLETQDLPAVAPLNPAPRAPMREDTRARLVERFAPDVAEVERLLGRTMPWANFHP
jgi:hypothetical protein